MDGNEIASIVSSSAGALYDYLTDMQWVDDPPKGVSETRVESCDVMDGYAILHLSSLLSDSSGLMLKVGPRVCSEEEAGFSRYDEVSKTVLVRPGFDVLDMMAEPDAKISVLTDMRFLVLAVKEFYRTYGDSIRLPDNVPADVRPVYPDTGTPTDEQRMAAEGLLSSKLSYVWGAPGTGKTQFVLSSAIRGCLRAGERVAVFAPTNNSVEQVLRGVLSSVPPEELGGVIRLGIPTRRFFSEHPEMCEDRQVQRLLERTMESLTNLEEARYERVCEAARKDLDRLSAAGCDAWDLTDLRERHPELAPSLDSILAVCGMRAETSVLAERECTLSEFLDSVRKALYGRQRPAIHIDEYSMMSDGDMESMIASLKEEEKRLRASTTCERMSAANIVAATPQQFISRFRPRGSEEDGRMELDVDRIFLDEAGYCGFVQALSLFSNGVPVAMLGDHMQLPPVSELDPEQVRSWASRPCRMEDSFLWTLPALECEKALTAGMEDFRRSYLADEGPRFDITSRYDLTRTRRFGSNLATVLDRYVYRNGLSGEDGHDIDIACFDAQCTHRENRENDAEAMMVSELLKAESPDPKDVCILTPYSVQCSLLRSKVPRRYRDCVMTVHGSQGREWDTVILSVADCGVISRDVPFRFTSSETPIGLKVINTAVSRAKKRLVMVCDRGFWESRSDELIGGIIKEAV